MVSKMISVTDKVLDCIPFVSLVKNGPILAYQFLHKTDKVGTETLGTRRTLSDELKIHILSKSQVLAALSCIPYVGNLCAGFAHLFSLLRIEKNDLKDAVSLEWPFWGANKNRNEVIALTLKDSGISDQDLASSLKEAAQAKNGEAIKLIISSRDVLPPKVVSEMANLLMCLSTYKLDLDLQKFILDKLPASLSGDEVHKALFGAIQGKSLEMVELILAKYPALERSYLIASLTTMNDSVPKEVFKLLLAKCPDITDEELKSAYVNAYKRNDVENMKMALEKAPHLLQAKGMFYELFYGIREDAKMDALLSLYSDDTPSSEVTYALHRYMRAFLPPLNVVSKLLKKFPNLPAKELEPIVIISASNKEHLAFYLKQLPQLKLENLQAISDGIESGKVGPGFPVHPEAKGIIQAKIEAFKS